MFSTEENRERFSVKFCRKVKNVEDNFVYQSGDELIIESEGLVQIIDVMGRVVISKEVNGNDRINVNNLNKSAYIVRCVNNANVQTQKIVIH